MKQRLYLLIAFGLGAIVTYGIVSLPKHPEQWGVIVASVSQGARLWGLFDSKGECFDAREAVIKWYGREEGSTLEEYGVMAGRPPEEYGAMLLHKKGSRWMLLKSGDDRMILTFSCLPLSEIRGLSLADGGDHGVTR